MQNKLNKSFATGIDTPITLVILTSISFILIYIFAPYIFVPDFKYMHKISFFKITNIEDDIVYIVVNSLRDNISNFTYNKNLIFIFSVLVKVFILISIVLLLIFIYQVYKNKKKAFTIGLISYIFSTLVPLMSIFICNYINLRINNALKIENNFLNLTAFSKVQLTSAPFIQILISIIAIIFLKRILFVDISQNSYKYKEIENTTKISKRTKIAFIIIFSLIPLIIAFGVIFLKNRSFYFISICVILLSMLPFFMIFEDRKPQAREIVVISVMVVIATMGRTVFSMLPNFKPVTAIVIISGIGLGPEAGFLTGAMTGFISNFFFGQGPWTPWQMFAFGIIGFLSGIIFRNERKKYAYDKIIISIFGGIATFIIYGFIMDTSSALSFLDGLTWNAVIAKYISGIPINITHGISTIIFLIVMTKPILKKLERIKQKYGILT